MSFLLFIGVLLRHTSCLFCMVFAKKKNQQKKNRLLREEIFYHFLFATLDLKRFLPFPVPSFLNSIFWMSHL